MTDYYAAFASKKCKKSMLREHVSLNGLRSCPDSHLMARDCWSPASLSPREVVKDTETRRHGDNLNPLGQEVEGAETWSGDMETDRADHCVLFY